MFTTLGLLSLLTVADRAPARAPTSGGYRARIEVWTNRGDDPYGSGQSVRVYFRADQDAYVTILRVDTDGRVRVLFPREPWEDNFARGGRDYEVLNGSDRAAFYIDDYPGEDTSSPSRRPTPSSPTPPGAGTTGIFGWSPHA